MKPKQIITIVLCLVLAICGIICFADIVHTVQSKEDIERIKAYNTEYEKTHPKPKTAPKRLNVSFTELSTDGKNTDFERHDFANENPPIVYMDADNMAYHLGACQYYAEQPDRNYSNPQWLTDVIKDKVRCTHCIRRDIYYLYLYGLSLAEQKGGEPLS